MGIHLPAGGVEVQVLKPLTGLQGTLRPLVWCHGEEIVGLVLARAETG